MKVPRVWSLLADRMQSSVRVVVITRDILRFTIAGLRATRPTAIEPFRFCRQPIFPLFGEHSNFAVECDELRAVLIRMVSFTEPIGASEFSPRFVRSVPVTTLY